jgi:type VI secretion system protein VasD
VSLGGWERRNAQSLAPLAAVLALAARFALAAADPAAVPTALELTVVGAPTLNPNAEGRPSPVVVRIYDLAAVHAFEAADFAALFEHPDNVLQADLLTQEEFVVRPGEIQQHNRNLEAHVQALGVVAAFRDLGQAVWHLAVPVKPGRRNFILIDLDRNTIRLVDQGQS